MWCGFDEKMRNGICVYAEGVARAIDTKAKSCGVSFAEQMAKECIELATLERLIDERLAKSVDDPETCLQLRAFGGLVSVARFLIEKNKQPDVAVKNELLLARDAYALGALIDEFDKVFMALRQEDGHPQNASITLNRVIPLRNPVLSDAKK